MGILTFALLSSSVLVHALPMINVEDSCRTKFFDPNEKKIQAHYDRHPTYYSSVKTDEQTMKFFARSNITSEMLSSVKTFLDIGKTRCFLEAV